MRDRVMQLILLIGIVLMVGFVIGVKTSNVLDRAEESLAAEIAKDFR